MLSNKEGPLNNSHPRYIHGNVYAASTQGQRCQSPARSILSMSFITATQKSHEMINLPMAEQSAAHTRGAADVSVGVAEMHCLTALEIPHPGRRCHGWLSGKAHDERQDQRVWKWVTNGVSSPSAAQNHCSASRDPTAVQVLHLLFVLPHVHFCSFLTMGCPK